MSQNCRNMSRVIGHDPHNRAIFTVEQTDQIMRVLLGQDKFMIEEPQWSSQQGLQTVVQTLD